MNAETLSEMLHEKPNMEDKAIGDKHGEVKTNALLDTLAYM